MRTFWVRLSFQESFNKKHGLGVGIRNKTRDKLTCA